MQEQLCYISSNNFLDFIFVELWTVIPFILNAVQLEGLLLTFIFYFYFWTVMMRNRLLFGASDYK